MLQFVGRLRLWGLAFFLFSMPLFFLPGNTEYGYTKTIYTLVFVSILMVLWAVEGLLQREWRINLTWLFPVIPTFVAVALLSLTGGAALRLVMQSATVFLYFGFIYLLVVNTAEEDRDLVMLLGALLLAGFGTALFGLLQYVGAVPGGAEGGGLGALISSMGNRQFVAGFLSYLVLPAGVLLVRLRRPWWRAGALVLAGFVLAVMLLTRQVGVRLGLAVALCLSSFVLGLWPAQGARWVWWAAAAAAALLATGLVGGWPWFLAVAVLTVGCVALWGWARVLRCHRRVWIPTALLITLTLVLLIPVTTPLSGVRDLWDRQSGAVRAYDWWIGYEMWRDHPVFGIGLGAYKVEFVPYTAVFLETPRGENYDFPIHPAVQAHNEYVQVAAELGTAGFLVMLGGLGGVALFGLRRIALQQDPERRLELILLGGGALVTLVHATVTFPWRLPASSLAFVALLGMAFSPRYGPLGNWSFVLRGKALRALVVALAVLGATVSIIAVRDLIADRYLYQGRNELSMGNVERARALLQRSVDLDFFPRVSLYWLGRARLQAGELEAARDTLTQCFGRYVIDPVYLNLATAHVHLGENAQARELLTELLATRPQRDRRIAALYLLAVIELREGRLKSAETFAEEAVTLDRHHALSWMLLGDVGAARGTLIEAKAHYERALSIAAERIEHLEERLGRSLDAAEAARLRSEYRDLSHVREHATRMLAQLP